MEPQTICSLKLRLAIEKWPLARPFRITGKVFHDFELLRVILEKDDWSGQGEAVGVYYRNDTPALMARQIDSIRATVEAGISRGSLRNLLPAGGARNALDCAMWDLEAKLAGSEAWQIAGLEKPRALLTTFTCGADTPEKMAEAAHSYAGARAIKLKLTGEPIDVERIWAVREARPEVWLGVDANQGCTPAAFERLLPALVDAKVALVEQPFPVGRDDLLDGLRSPVRIAADETLQGLADLPRVAGRYQVANIKLDKCGGLTEALEMVRAARDLGLEPMIGNMGGTSLSMAPAFLVGQLCSVVDLDAPVFLRTDREPGVQYIDGAISCPDSVWGRRSIRGSSLQ